MGVKYIPVPGDHRITETLPPPKQCACMCVYICTYFSFFIQMCIYIYKYIERDVYTYTYVYMNLRIYRYK